MIRRLALVLLGFALVAGAGVALLHQPGASPGPPVVATSGSPTGPAAATPGAPGVAAVPGGPSPTAVRGQAPAVTSANRSAGGAGPTPMGPSSPAPQSAAAGAAGGSAAPSAGAIQANSGMNQSPDASAPLGIPEGLSLDVSCPGLQPQMKPGTTFTLTYTVRANSPGTLGLGAALYDASGADQANGAGDEDAVAFPVGTTSKSRPVLIPSSLSPGVYEADGELWVAHQIGLAADPLTSATCGDVTVTP